MSKTVKIVIAAALVVVVAGVGTWYFVLRSDASKEASLDAISAGAGGADRATADGTWKVQQDTATKEVLDKTVFGGYRVQELFGGETIKKTATAHSPEVSGTMTVKGNQITAADITVDTTKLTSNEVRRDAAMSTRGLQTQQFPTATFKLTEPIALPSAPAKNQEVALKGKGDLTLHGVTKSVEVPLKATWTGGAIKVATVDAGLPITLADYKIDQVEIPGFVKVDDRGTLELQLLFVPA